MNASITKYSRISRAIDFYTKMQDSGYFVVGKSSEWEDETEPPVADEDTIVEEIVGYRKVEVSLLVVLDEVYGTLSYKGNNWRIIKYAIDYSLLRFEANSGSNQIVLETSPKAEPIEGDRLQINKDEDEIYIVDMYDSSTRTVHLKSNLTYTYPVGTLVEFGAVPANCKWVYLKSELQYGNFPIENFRQVGIVSHLSVNEDYTGTTFPDGWSLYPEQVDTYGVLEAVENRQVVRRDIDQREQLIIIIEF